MMLQAVKQHVMTLVQNYIYPAMKYSYIEMKPVHTTGEAMFTGPKL